MSLVQKRIVSGVAIILLVAGIYAGYEVWQNSTTDAATCASRTFKPGSRSICIKYIQQMIAASSTDSSTAITVSGKFDTATKNAVASIQKSHNLSTSSKITPAVWQIVCTQSQQKALDAYNRAGCSITMIKYSRIATIKDCGTMQGGTSDGKYLYFACTHPSGQNDTDIDIVKYTTDGKKVDSSAKHHKIYHRADLGHVGGIAYDEASNRLVVSAWDDDTPGNSGVKNQVRFIDPKTFEITDTVSSNVRFDIRDICHKPNSTQYVSRGTLYDLKTLRDGTKQLVFTKQLYKNGEVDDEIGISYEREKAYKDAAGNTKMTNIIDNQSIACDSSYIYILRVIYRETGYNIVAVYDWNGENIGAYRVDLNDEAENLAIIGDKLYMGVNEGGESKGGKSANDYFVKLKTVSLSQDQ